MKNFQSYRFVMQAKRVFEILDLILQQQSSTTRGRVLGYWRHYDSLTHVVIKNAGHMVPRDDTLTSQAKPQNS